MKQKSYAEMSLALNEMGKVIQRLAADLKETKRLVAELLVAAHIHPDMVQNETEHKTDSKDA